MKKWSVLFIVVFAFACNPRIVSYLNPKSPYKTYETYRIVNPKVDNSNLDSETSFVFKKIKEEIEAQMARRNYVLSSVGPDLTLRYEVTSGTSVQSTTQQSLYYPGFNVNTRTIHETTLLLELLDQKKKLVWQGSYDLRQERKEKRINKVIENAMERIFTTYPYIAKNNQPMDSLRVFQKR